MANAVRKHTIEVYTPTEYGVKRSINAAELALWSLALERARRNLWDEFCQFKADSAAWAKFLQTGDVQVCLRGEAPRTFLKEALDITSAVLTAKKHVVKACGSATERSWVA